MRQIDKGTDVGREVQTERKVGVESLLCFPSNEGSDLNGPSLTAVKCTITYAIQLLALNIFLLHSMNCSEMVLF